MKRPSESSFVCLKQFVKLKVKSFTSMSRHIKYADFLCLVSFVPSSIDPLIFCIANNYFVFTESLITFMSTIHFVFPRCFFLVQLCVIWASFCFCFHSSSIFSILENIRHFFILTSGILAGNNQSIQRICNIQGS